MRLPVIQSCLRCAYVGADERCHHPRGADVEPIMDDGPPPPTCPARTGPDSARLAALEAAEARADAAEAQLAVLREAAGEVARKARYGTDGAHDYIRLESALADADSAAASYRARVEAEVLERTAELWLTSVDGNVRTSDRERMHNWLTRRANDIRSEAAKRKAGA